MVSSATRFRYCCPPGAFRPLAGRHLRGSRLAAFSSAQAAERNGRRILLPLGLRRRSLPDRLLEHLERQLVRVAGPAWALRHVLMAARGRRTGRPVSLHALSTVPLADSGRRLAVSPQEHGRQRARERAALPGHSESRENSPGRDMNQGAVLVAVRPVFRPLGSPERWRHQAAHLDAVPGRGRSRIRRARAQLPLDQLGEQADRRRLLAG